MAFYSRLSGTRVNLASYREAGNFKWLICDLTGRVKLYLNLMITASGFIYSLFSVYPTLPDSAMLQLWPIQFLP